MSLTNSTSDRQQASFFTDFWISLSRLSPQLYITWLKFLIHYRRTALGPLWLLVGPALFILFLGTLFSRVGNVDSSIFIPNLTIGLIAWTLIAGFITGSTTVFQRGRAQILQGGMGLTDITMVSVFTTVLTFFHQIILVAIVLVIYGVGVSFYSLVSLVGLALLIANGIWLTIFFGIIGARYRDLFEIMQAIMRIAFLATPIIWMPGEGGRGGVMGAFLIYNPFYHFLELIRAPLLGNPIAPLSWIVVITITFIGFILANYFYNRFAKNIPLWV